MIKINYRKTKFGGHLMNTCHGILGFGSVVDSGTTVHSPRPWVEVLDTTTTGRCLTISGALNPVSKLQISTSPVRKPCLSASILAGLDDIEGPSKKYPQQVGVWLTGAHPCLGIDLDERPQGFIPVDFTRKLALRLTPEIRGILSLTTAQEQP